MNLVNLTGVEITVLHIALEETINDVDHSPSQWSDDEKNALFILYSTVQTEMRNRKMI